MIKLNVACLLFDVLATSKVILGQVPNYTVHTHGDFIVLPHRT